MKITEIITESKSADLYHGTGIEQAEEILTDDAFYLSTESSTESQVSLSRTFNIAWQFAQYGDGGAGVIFIIDHDKLSRHVGKKQKPFDYMGYMDGEGGGEEFEEAVFVDIKNASSLIKKIVVLEHGTISPESYPKVLLDPRTVVLPQNDIEHIVSGRQFYRYLQKKEDSENSKPK